MSERKYTDAQVAAALKLKGSINKAAPYLNMARSSLQERVRRLNLGTAQSDKLDEFSAKRELSNLRSEVKRLQGEAADLSAIRKMIGDVSSRVTDAPAWLDKLPPSKAKHYGVPTLMLSDLHFGEVVFPGQVNGVNQYNKDIAKIRLRKVVSKAVTMLRTTLAPGSFGGMVVQLGGDMLDGTIHDELRDTADETVLQAIVTLHDELVPALKSLCDEFGKLHVPCVVGNHGRLDRKPRMKNGPFLNHDWLLYQFIAKTISNSPKYASRITFQIPDGFDCVYRVHGLRYLLTHGDSFSGGNGITGPLLPWMRGQAKTQQQYGAIGLPFDVLCFGHWHQLRFLVNQRNGIIVNGSLCGFNEYALKNRFAYEQAAQALWLTSPKGRVWFTTAVDAEEPRDTAEAAWCEVRAAA